jgi:hypothetical protein
MEAHGVGARRQEAFSLRPVREGLHRLGHSQDARRASPQQGLDCVF